LLPENLSTKLEIVTLPDGAEGVRASFDSPEYPELAGYSVELMADSLAPGASYRGLEDTTRITTMVAKFYRGVLAEVNTHRLFSRNSASSRAKSIKVVISEVMENPYIPLFTENRKGMSGDLLDLDQQRIAAEGQLLMRDAAVAQALGLLLNEAVDPRTIRDTWRELVDRYYQQVYLGKGEPIPGALNIHKQNVNRWLEPFMWHEAVITSTHWKNFVELRDHDEADPAIHALGRLVADALEFSTPVERIVHAPFGQRAADAINPLSTDAFDAAVQAAEITSGSAAQVSYRPVNSDSATDAGKLAKRLLAMNHMSPFEHAAFDAGWLEAIGFPLEAGDSRNFSDSWIQFRALAENPRELILEP